jgi:hypothetical protein
MKKKISIYVMVFMVLVSITTVSVQAGVIGVVLDFFTNIANCGHHCERYNGAFYGQHGACMDGCMHGAGY